ncbi:MAG: hypothetical protein U1E05_18565, partial [Patescibacteria group bacterium]|nr:hypothetical protein [Patescibacteria group bacterium]
MRTVLTFLMVWFALFGLAAAAPLRTWTDVRGNTTSASFVRIHNGMVILMRGNSPLRLPFERFSQEDQQHIRELLEAEGKGNLLPTHRPSGGGGAEPNATPPRLWTDVRGNRVTGRLIRVEAPNVQLEVNGQTKSYPISGFSLADQDVIRTWTAQNGEQPLPGGGQNRMTADEMHAELVRRQKESVRHQPEPDESGMAGGHNSGMSGRHDQTQVSTHRSPVDDGQPNRWEIRPRSENGSGGAGQATPSGEAQESIDRQNALLAEREAWKRYQNDRNAPIPNFVVSICD